MLAANPVAIKVLAAALLAALEVRAAAGVVGKVTQDHGSALQQPVRIEAGKEAVFCFPLGYEPIAAGINQRVAGRHFLAALAAAPRAGIVFEHGAELGALIPHGMAAGVALVEEFVLVVDFARLGLADFEGVRVGVLGEKAIRFPQEFADFRLVAGSEDRFRELVRYPA